MMRPAAEQLLPMALDLPALEGSRVVALCVLQHAVAARARVAEVVAAPGESAAATTLIALDGVQRVRAVLREQSALLDTRKGVLRHLRRLERALEGAARPDRERAWIARYAESSDAMLAQEASSMRGSLRADESEQHVANQTQGMLDDIGSAFARHFDPFIAELETALSEYTERRVVGEGGAQRSLAAHVAMRVSIGAAALDRDAGSGALRRVRSRALRQHLSLAPLAPQSPALADWLTLCANARRQAESALDAARLARRARQRGHGRLADALEADRHGLAEALGATWRTAATSRAEAAVAAMTERSATQQSSTPLHAAALPMEIERKFLLRAAPPIIHEVQPILIEQGWLPGTVLRERLRRSVYPDGRTVLTRTVKAGPLGARVELEEEASTELFTALWPHTQQARIRKQRYAIAEGEYTWEIDVFADRELVVAEVELPDVTAMPSIPDWLAPFVERDVTQEPAYTNSAMARPDRESDANLSA